MSQDDIQSAQELTNFVNGLFEQMNARFQEMSNSIVNRIDEMGKRIDDLESTVNKLVDENQNQLGMNNNISQNNN